MPRVSVIIPTFNRARTIQRSINSVLAQTYDDYEIIVVDDGSTDNTKSLIAEYDNSKIKYYFTEINSGASAARNYGIGKASGNIIAFQDSDDCWRRDKLARVIDSFDADPEIGFVYHKMQFNFTDGRQGVLPSGTLPLDQMHGDIYATLLMNNLIGCPALSVKRECIENIGLFDTNLKALEDYDFAIRLAQKYKAGYVNEVLIDVEFSTTGVSGNSANYLVASCMLLGKYKKDYLLTNTFDHRVDLILKDAKRLNIEDKILKVLELVLK